MSEIDYDDQWEEGDGYDCRACGAQDSLLENWEEDGRFAPVCGDCGAKYYEVEE